METFNIHIICQVAGELTRKYSLDQKSRISFSYDEQYTKAYLKKVELENKTWLNSVKTSADSIDFNLEISGPCYPGLNEGN